jgi:hypothetical protein
MTHLSYDIARCPGYEAEGLLREGCADCLRRTAPGNPEGQAYLEPPRFVVFECFLRIAPEAA